MTKPHNSTAALTCDLPIAATHDGPVTDIHLVRDAAALTAWSGKANKSHQVYLENIDFSASANRWVALPNRDGSIQILGTAMGDRPLYQTAYLAPQLPAGAYRIASIDGSKPAKDDLIKITVAWGLASYRFAMMKSKEATSEPTLLVTGDEVDLDALSHHIRATWLTRDLVNLPSNHMGPAELAAAAKALAKHHKAKFSVIDDQEELDREYPAIYAVGKASDRAPRLIDFSWGKKRAPKVTLVGKGVCFDTGGLDLKPSNGMLNMKKDMGGSAQVLGLAHLIMARNLPVRLRVLIPAVENAVSGNAFRPRDVIRTRAGMTVEVGNTDAEGRLVLADALTLADAEEPDLMIDFATLTGAARVALGPDLPAMMTDDDELADGLYQAGMAVGDPVWRLPLWKPYTPWLDSKVADTNNISSAPFAGTITAGLFLKKFVKKSKSWAHFDVFAWTPSGRPGQPDGGEAQAMRAAFSLISKRYGGIDDMAS
ncbi:MAG: leucyl aminopeptidase family protein [Alphaproteobacteria bacterium]|nr:leucyl aminopeptidase family protein [Alphaproteobacteria bacterium SS10]